MAKDKWGSDCSDKDSVLLLLRLLNLVPTSTRL